MGDLLRRTREEQGVSLAQLASLLRIKESHLAAIEGARYDDLPGPTYALGFVRTYANHLGLDGDEAVRRFKLEAGPIERQRDLIIPAPLTERGIPGRGIIVTALILLVCAYGIWHYVQADRTRPERVAAVPSDLLPPPPPAKAPTAAPQAAQPQAAKPATPAAAVPAQAATPAAPQQTAAGPTTAAAPTAVAPPAAPAAPASPSALPLTQVTQAPLAPPGAPGLVARAPPPVPATAVAQNTLPPGSAPASSSTAVQAAAPAPAAPAAQAPQGEARSQGPVVRPVPGQAPPPGVASVPLQTAAVNPQAAAGAPPPPTGPKVYGAVTGPSHITLKATQDCWIMVRDGTDAVVAERLLHAGDSYRVPDRTGLVLRTGNASGLAVTVDDKPAPALGGTVREVTLDPQRLLAGTAVE